MNTGDETHRCELDPRLGPDFTEPYLLQQKLAAAWRDYDIQAEQRSKIEANLVAEREKVKLLMIALERIRAKVRNHTVTITARVAAVTVIIDDALAKVKQ